MTIHNFKIRLSQSGMIKQNKKHVNYDAYLTRQLVRFRFLEAKSTNFHFKDY